MGRLGALIIEHRLQDRCLLIDGDDCVLRVHRHGRHCRVAVGQQPLNTCAGVSYGCLRYSVCLGSVVDVDDILPSEHFAVDVYVLNEERVDGRPLRSVSKLDLRLQAGDFVEKADVADVDVTGIEVD